MSVPFSRDLCEGVCGGDPASSRGGEPETGVAMPFGDDRLLTDVEPLVAAIDGEAGGSGDRVKYTIFANEPPI